MRIIERGEPEQTWPRSFTVRCCKSVLEIEPTDIKTSRDYTGGLNGYYIDCPVCGEQPEVNRNVKNAGDRWQRAQDQIQHNDV